jgi:hypothetical protein
MSDIDIFFGLPVGSECTRRSTSLDEKAVTGAAGQHAEIKGISSALHSFDMPAAIGASRAACVNCAKVIKELGLDVSN